MLDGLLKSKFYTKCKSAIKLTKVRIEMIKRKRNAMLKYLKNDLVDLLKNGFDTNAYGRVEGLLNELNLSSCYEYVELCCMTISSHIATMEKQRECPEECKEAAASLIFAAARFSDLPELRELRTIFSERFGNSIELYVNKEFVNKLKSTPPTRDMKLLLMQEIASQSGLEWDSKTLERKLHKNPTASAPDPVKNGNDEKSNIENRTKNADQKIDNIGAECKNKDSLKEVRKGIGDGRNQSHRSHSEPKDTAPAVKDIQVDRVDRKVKQKEMQAVSTSEEENDDKTPFNYKSIRPPYTKTRISITPDTSPTTTDPDKTGQERIQSIGHGDDSDGLRQDESDDNTKLKPKSVRRIQRKAWPGQENVENSSPVGSENTSFKGISQRGEEQDKQNLKIVNERKHDEDERIMDRLLMHYSRKKLPPDTGDSAARDLQHSPEKVADNMGRGKRDSRRDGPPTRVASLPAESSPTEVTRLHARASSFQPPVLKSNSHVHPKAPDYDDFVARLAALRATLK